VTENRAPRAMSISDRLERAMKERKRLDDTILTLKQQINGRAPNGSDYYFTDVDTVVCSTESGHVVDQARFLQCNYFQSRCSAEIVAMISLWHRYLFTRMHCFYGSGWRPEKICWSVLPISSQPVETHPPFTPENAYFETFGDAEQVINDMPERLREWVKEIRAQAGSRFGQQNKGKLQTKRLDADGY